MSNDISSEQNPKPTNGAGNEGQPELAKVPGPGLKASWLQTLVAGVVLLVIVTILISLVYSAEFLTLLRDKEYARGLITFLVAVATISLAFIMVTASIFVPKEDLTDDRFRRAREIFLAMMGVLGTIVGFYFGANETPEPQLGLSKIQVVDLSDTEKQVAAHISGGSSPYTYSITFDKASLKPVSNREANDGWVLEKIKTIEQVGFKLEVRDSKGNATTGLYRAKPASDG